MCRGSRFAGHYCVHPAGSSCPLFTVGLVWPEVLARRASGECAGAHDSPDTTAFTLRAAPVPSLRLAWWPEVLARRASGECAGAHDSPDTTAFTLRAALAPLVTVGLVREHEVHGLACGGPVEPPFLGQAGDQHQAASCLRIRWPIHRHRHRVRRVVNFDAQLARGTGDDER